MSGFRTDRTLQSKKSSALSLQLEKARAALATLRRPLPTAVRTADPGQGQAAALLAATTDIIVVQDATGVIRYASPSIEQVLGYHPVELLGLPASALIHPEDAVLLEDAQERARQPQQDHGAKLYRIRHRDGSWRHIEAIRSNLLDHPEVQGIVVSARDVTDRVWAESRFNRQITLYETLLRAQNDAGEGFILVEEWFIRYANAAITRLSGYNEAELTTLPSFLLLFAPDDRLLLRERLKQRLLGHQVDLRFEISLQSKKGENVPVEIVIEASIVEGRRQFVIVAHDITERQRAQAALRDQLNFTLAMTSNLGEGVLTFDRDRRLTMLNPAARRMLGLASGETAYIGKPIDEVIRLRCDGATSSGANGCGALDVLRSGMVVRVDDDVILRADGSELHVAYTASPINTGGELTGVVVVCRDISNLKALERQRADERFRSLVQHAADVITVIARDGSIDYISPSVERVLGHPPAGLIGRPGRRLIHPHDARRLPRLLGQLVMSPGEHAAVEVRALHHDGSLRHLEITINNLLDDPNVGGIIVNARDISERKRFEEQLTHQAFHDPLTGLPNRSLFMAHLGQLLEPATRRRTPFAVLFLDLDRFKVINDSLGHATGDALLVAVGKRLLHAARPSDIVARLGGDEFTILLKGIDDPAAARQVAERISEQLRPPFKLGNQELFVSASVGIALGSNSPQHADDFLRDADTAMYRAKLSGKARYEIFDSSMRRAAVERLALETDLRHALERGEFRVHYQPIVRLQTGQIEGVEALVRWEHPQRGMIAPGSFIATVEEMGLMTALGNWVLEEACRQARLWHDELPTGVPLMVSVNLSAKQFQQPGLARDILGILERTGLAADRLQLEITESVLMADVQSTDIALRQLQELGIRFAVDDFGTGYSSLSYLKRFPVDMLKIDQSFIQGLGGDGDDATIVRAIVTLAQALGVKSTAEGIENAAQEASLAALGCDSGQGYYLSRPIPAAALTALLASNASPRSLAAR